MKMEMIRIQGLSAENLKQMLLDIYPCSIPFTVQVSKRTCKTMLGTYFRASRIIRIYNFSNLYDAREVAIHEYAHHINCSEWWNCQVSAYKYEASHGYKFWYIYSKLIDMAIRKNLIITPRYYGRAGRLFE